MKPPYNHIDLPEACILLQPNIPKPMHGLNPRTILGKAWWDEHRRNAYQYFNERCWACGIPKHNAKYHQWLEGHEAYRINYEQGRIEMVQIMALCHMCHNFIHSGRMVMLLQKKKMEWNKYLEILHHGFFQLKLNDQPANWFALSSYNTATKFGTNQLGSHYPRPKWHSKAIELFNDTLEPKLETAPWEDWRMIIEGVEYEPIHKSFEDWIDYYQKPKREHDPKEERIWIDDDICDRDPD